MPEVPKGPERPQESSSTPLVLIPVSAEDVARRSRRIKLSIWAGVILALALAGWYYKRTVDPLQAKESYDSGLRLLKVARVVGLLRLQGINGPLIVPAGE